MNVHTCGHTVLADVTAVVEHLAHCPETQPEIGAMCRAIVAHVAAAVVSSPVSRDTTETPVTEICAKESEPWEVRDTDGVIVSLVIKHCELLTGHDGEHQWPSLIFGHPGWTEYAPSETAETRHLTPAEMHAMHRDGGGDSLRDIAAIAGVAPETVRRRIAKWKREGES